MAKQYSNDKMYPLSIQELLNWIAFEKMHHDSIFQIPFARIKARNKIGKLSVLGETCALPIGPAAGPHTQLAQNLITAYLCGGRFFELKTVQILDALEFAKPCIDAVDECYNTEWSTELSLAQAFDEYLKAWIILHLLQTVLFDQTEADFIFNMSIGYDLVGIKKDKMQQFIDGMINAKHHPSWEKMLLEIDEYFNRADLPLFWQPLKTTFTEITNVIRPSVSTSVTLSTMHGCPPREIESIASYLLEEKSLHTYVKLNPTLLGYEFVRNTLDSNGFDQIALDEEVFNKDLRFADAVPMLSRLQKLANLKNLHFGVKLSNTLAVKNQDDVLPGNEKYMSGRSLFPLTINLAKKIFEAFSGSIRISYSGGANAQNIVAILQSGIYPVTVATDLLKPGGYLRLADMADTIEASGIDIPRTIIAPQIENLAQSSSREKIYKKMTQMPLRPYPKTKLAEFDCFEAPCVSACPIHQDIPRYLELAGKGEYEKALQLIYDKNPLPNITGYICDHQCEYHCTRNDYEIPLAIREVKRIAAAKGKKWKAKQKRFKSTRNSRVAIIGAGPAGLSAAYFSIRNGFSVTVFEKSSHAGGVVHRVLPNFRMTLDALEEDIRFIRELGAKFQFSASQDDIRVDNLKAKGYDFIFFAIGAEKTRKLNVDIPQNKVYGALDLLEKFKKNNSFIKPGKNVIVIGGGNTAMDSSRVAKRLPGVEKVSIVYRRSINELPADREEFDMAMGDGVEFISHLTPISYKDDYLKFEKMALGEVDDSGRAAPLPTGNYVNLPADLIISAIGESVETNVLRQAGVDTKEAFNGETNISNVFIGGDARTGPATVVEAIADARAFVDEICKRESAKEAGVQSEFINDRPDLKILFERRGSMQKAGVSGEKIEQNSNFEMIEASRCLHCDILCNKCVEVCPNRANFAIATPEIFSNPYQIIHLDDLCNECGNCATFCPHDGKPYRDKMTLFNSEENFKKSENPGFFIGTNNDENSYGQLRWKGKITDLTLSESKITIDRADEFISDKNEMAKISTLIKRINTDYSYLIFSRKEDI